MSEHTETADELRDVLFRNGFARCDIAACNCGSWHARFGLPQRMEEIKEILSDAGHPLTNENGHLVKLALSELVAQRDELTEACKRLLHCMDLAGWDGDDAAIFARAAIKHAEGTTP
jgi:dephospho-CoA kinase